MSDIESFASALREHARAADHRRLLVLSGSDRWCRSTGHRVLLALAPDSAVWVSDEGPGGVETVRSDRSHGFLGRELDFLVIDARAGFDPDALGALSGAIRGGGIALLLCPPLDTWPDYVDPENRRIAVAPHGPEAVGGRFIARIVRELSADPDVVVIREGAPPPVLAAPSPAPPGPRADAEQMLAVEAVEHVATGHRRRPLVLTSDRGRGKSAALGIGAAHLMRRGIERIIVTAPRPDSAEQVFRHAALHLPGARSGRYSLSIDEAELFFVAPDELVQTHPPADLLLVDEAAAIPSPMLERMLERYSRIVFSTTVHGYEGTGRGFAVRFQQVLERRTPGWRALRLHQPIRWAAQDPLERFVFRALLLDAAPVPADRLAGVTPDECIIERLDRDRLAADEAAVRELFGLLVLAHYRTRPLDLRQLLDGPNVSVWAMRFDGHIVATALTAREGGFEPPLARAIYEGRRRPRGHLIAQSLAAHLGLEEGPLLLGDRIMRIAVHPAVQDRGLGSRLIEAVTDRARAEGIDYVGASFGATVPLVRFWRRLRFAPARVGLSREASSGAHSVMMLRGLSPAGRALAERAENRFAPQFIHLLSDALRELAPELVPPLLERAHPSPACLGRQDWLDVIGVAHANRGYEDALLPVWTLTATAVSDAALMKALENAARTVLVTRVLQRRPWQEVAHLAGLSGRRETVQALRRALSAVAACYAPDEEKGALESSP